MDSLLDNIARTLKHACRVAPGASILVGVSGGADSTALVHSLDALGYSCVVGHVHHGLRGAEADADAEFVETLANRLGLPFKLGRLDAGRAAETSHDSIEMAARKGRYHFLTQWAQETECDAIATAHHADDQAETLLMRILRGATPKGLAGIPARGEWNGVPVLRPFLHTTRAEIETYLSQRDIEFREDTSNADPTFLRNRIRHELLPQLSRDYNPQFRDALCRLSEIQSNENDFLDGETRALGDVCLGNEGTLHRATFRAAHRALQTRLLAALCWREGVEPDYARLHKAADFIASETTGKSFDLGGGVSLTNGRDDTAIRRQEDERDPLAVELPVPGETRFGNQSVVIKTLDPIPEDAARACGATRQVFDADALHPPLHLRRATAGDRFAPLGLGGHKKVSDYLADRRVPRWERERQLVLTAADRIVWLVGHTIDESVALGPKTKRCLEIEVRDASE